MYHRAAIALLALLTTTSSVHLTITQDVLQQAPLRDTYRIPTVHESAVQARRILSLESIGTLSTVFPAKADSDSARATEDRPAGMGGAPIGLIDYYADCEPERGDPTLLAITIATSFKNVAAGSNITMSLRWHPPDHRQYSAMALPRFSLVGHLEEITDAELKENQIKECFVKTHPDAHLWLPGNPIHVSRWTRLVVDEIYWIGGFGDVAYIGWIPVEDWRSVTKKEIDSILLPGEFE